MTITLQVKDLVMKRIREGINIEKNLIVVDTFISF